MDYGSLALVTSGNPPGYQRREGFCDVLGVEVKQSPVREQVRSRSAANLVGLVATQALSGDVVLQRSVAAENVPLKHLGQLVQTLRARVTHVGLLDCSGERDPHAAEVAVQRVGGGGDGGEGERRRA
jgi:hypothetical protein